MKNHLNYYGTLPHSFREPEEILPFLFQPEEQTGSLLPSIYTQIQVLHCVKILTVKQHQLQTVLVR